MKKLITRQVGSASPKALDVSGFTSHFDVTSKYPPGWLRGFVAATQRPVAGSRTWPAVISQKFGAFGERGFCS